MDLLNEVEHRYPVDSWRVGRLHVWPIVRHQMSWYFDEGDDQVRRDAKADRSMAREVSRAANFTANLARCARAALADRAHNASLRDPADVVVLGDNVSRDWIDGAWYDRLCEPVIEALRDMGMRSLHLEPNHLYRTPRHGPARFIQPALDLRWLATRRPLSEELRRPPLEGYADFEALLRHRGLRADLVGETRVRRQAWFALALAQYFSSILGRVGAVAGVLVDNALIQMAFNHACRERSIPSIELQHGFQGDLHAAYARWTRLPEDGYSLLPTVYWTWSEMEASTIRRWAGPVSHVHRPVVGGNPWLDLWRDGNSDVVKQQDLEISHMLRSRAGDVHILLTLQTGAMSEAHLRLFRAAIERAPSSWYWWARTHPSMRNRADLQRVSAILDPGDLPNLEVEEAQRRPLYAWLRHVDAHVTVRSTTIIEAESLGVPSVGVGDEVLDVYPTQATSGWLLHAATAVDLITAVRTQLERAPTLRSSRHDARAASPTGVLEEILAGAPN